MKSPIEYQLDLSILFNSRGVFSNRVLPLDGGVQRIALAKSCKVCGAPRNPTDPFLCLCSCLKVVDMHVYVCMERPEEIRCHFSGANHNFKDKIPYYLATSLGSLSNKKTLGKYIVLQTCHSWFFLPWPLVIALRSLCLQGKHSTESPTRPLWSISSYFPRMLWLCSAWTSNCSRTLCWDYAVLHW